MEIAQTDMSKTRRKRLKIFLWICFPIFFFVPFFVGISTDVFGLLSLISFSIGIISLFIIIYISRNYYKLPLVLFIFYYIGILFKSFHWPFAGVILTLSTLILSLVSFVIIFKNLFSIGQNQFIKWFSISTAVVTATFMSGWVIMIQHWDVGIATTLGYSGCIIMIITVLALVFTLPNSNYIGWTALERKIFYRLIVIPMFFLIVMMTINLVFPKAWAVVMNLDSVRWNLNGIELQTLEGIPKL
jgi:hypothetical protein